MSRVLGLLVLLLLLAPCSVHADEAIPRLDARNFELLPLNDLEKPELQRDHPELAREIALLTRRATRMRKLLAGRKSPDDDG